jgi:hypothetical protein
MHKIHSTQICVTPDVESLMDLGHNLAPFVTRHLNGDWGDINDAERARNLESLKNGTGHVLSVYPLTPDITLWISTRAGITAIMLPLA